MTVGDWITLTLALATGVMAFATWRMASAAGDEVTEIRADRELAWRPVLTVPNLIPTQLFVDDPGHRPKPVPGEVMTIRNVGGGPALKCRVLIRRDAERWCLTGAVDLPAHGGSQDMEVPSQTGTVPFELLGPATAADDQNRCADAAIFCEDALGRRYRFVVMEDSRGLWTHSPEIHRTAEDAAPSWVHDTRLWPG